MTSMYTQLGLIIYFGIVQKFLLTININDEIDHFHTKPYKLFHLAISFF